jgi:FMN phosphatase YigB (HAD superfamily)
MITIHGVTLFSDVDETLILFGKEDHPEAIELENNGFKMRVVPHKKHIDMIKRCKFRGHRIVVWSAGGSEWAEHVVKSLGLEDYVDLVISKPDFYIDDLKSDKFMPESNRVYFNDYEDKE